MVRVHDGYGWLYLDVCDRGRFVEDIPEDSCMGTMPNADWLERFISQNSEGFELGGQRKEHEWMENLGSLLKST